jgi:cysteinyl-tRNA synthetase
VRGKKLDVVTEDTYKLKLYNTLTRKRDVFKPICEGEVKMYSCGPTVYDFAHIGHFRAYVFVDTLKRVLGFNGFKLKTVMNITDVGHLTSDADSGLDKIEKAAAEKQMSAWEIAAYYTKDFFDALDKLNVALPDVVCKATDHIRQMIELIEALEKKGYTYKTSDGVYYDTSKFKRYADFAHLNTEQLKEGARVEPNPEKRNPTDFALWKFSPKDQKRQMEWDSPWGKGFPGWHIECSAMDMHYLGDHFDIHTGGIDHIPIHHTNEIAQSDAAVGHRVVNFWLHNDFVLVDGEKMSKSKRNFYNMADIEAKGIDPLAVRYLFLTATYRSKINFTFESLDASSTALNTLRERVTQYKESVKDKPIPDKDRERVEIYEAEFKAAVNDDLNTPNALSVTWQMVRNQELSDAAKLHLLLEFDKVFGLKLGESKVEKKELSEEVKDLIEKREEFRKEGKYQEADEIRKRLLSEFGVAIEDSSKGTGWKAAKK